MKSRVLLFSAVGISLSVVMAPTVNAAPISFRHLGDVQMDGGAARVIPSPSGRHIAVQYRSSSYDNCLAVYTERNSDALHVKRLPDSRPRWGKNDILSVRVTGKRVNLAPYDEVVEMENRLALNHTSVTTLERLAAAAWIYCEDKSYEVTTPGGERVFDTLPELSSLTKESYKYESRPYPSPGTILVCNTLAQYSAAESVYFVNDSGNRMRGPGSVSGLFMVEEGRRKKLSLPDLNGSMRSETFRFDAVKKRVSVVAGNDTLVYDCDDGTYRTFPRAGIVTRTETIIYLVPGEDHLIARMNQLGESGHNYADQWLELWDLDGNRLSTIPTSVDGSEDAPPIGKVVLSENLLAVTLNFNVLRVFSIDKTR
ncbi:hypothetical protein ACFL1X_07890 [Candidatus Hydrogenedentota bacterium]